MNVLVSLFNSLPGAAGQGLIWGIMAIGVYITYKILDVADLTVDGSLATGGAVAALAFVFDMPLVLIPVGIIYILETLSDIIQVGYFKLTHGKRFFKMAPLHHHLELSGWSEAKLVAVFSLVTLAGCVLAYLGVQGRF
jgi:branched-subunit amino acid ABC-type transport system permease component